MIATHIFRLANSISSLAFVRRNRFDGCHRYHYLPGAMICPIYLHPFWGRSTDFDDESYGDAVIRERLFANTMARLVRGDARLFVDAGLKHRIARALAGNNRPSPDSGDLDGVANHE